MAVALFVLTLSVLTQVIAFQFPFVVRKLITFSADK